MIYFHAAASRYRRKLAYLVRGGYEMLCKRLHCVPSGVKENNPYCIPLNSLHLWSDTRARVSATRRRVKIIRTSLTLRRASFPRSASLFTALLNFPWLLNIHKRKMEFANRMIFAFIKVNAGSSHERSSSHESDLILRDLNLQHAWMRNNVHYPEHHYPGETINLSVIKWRNLKKYLLLTLILLHYS